MAVLGADEGEGSGGEGTESGQTQPASTTTAAPPAATPPPTQTLGLDKDTLQQLLTTAVASGVQATKPEQQMSDEEYRKMFNIYGPTVDQLQNLGIEATPERVALFDQMMQSVARQAVTMSKYQMELYKRQIAEELAPMAQFIQEARQNQLRDRFFAKHPDLKGLEPLLVTIRDHFIKEGRKFSSEEEAFQAVADKANSIRSSLTGGTGGGAAAGQTQRPTPTRGMTRLSSGGQGGAGDRGAAGADKPLWQKVLG